MMMTDLLLPCPFCGTAAFWDSEVQPCCNNVECQASLVPADTAEEAVADWNRRAPDPRDAHIAALEARVAELEADLAEARKPQWYNDYDDGEYSANTWEELLEYADYDEVVHLTGSRSVFEGFAAYRCLSLDEDGEPDEQEPALFDTREAAAACWRDSLASLRALLSKGNNDG